MPTPNPNPNPNISNQRDILALFLLNKNYNFCKNSVLHGDQQHVGPINVTTRTKLTDIPMLNEDIPHHQD